MATARQVAEANVPVPTASPFMFELTAAAHNTSILESFDYNLATAIVAYPGTTISPGSELTPPEQLEPRLSHPTRQEFLEDSAVRDTFDAKPRDTNTPTRPANTKRIYPHRVSIPTKKEAHKSAPMYYVGQFSLQRSCEDTYVGTTDRKTRPIEARDITFMIGNRITTQLCTSPTACGTILATKPR